MSNSELIAIFRNSNFLSFIEFLKFYYDRDKFYKEKHRGLRD